MGWCVRKASQRFISGLTWRAQSCIEHDFLHDVIGDMFVASRVPPGTYAMYSDSYCFFTEPATTAATDQVSFFMLKGQRSVKGAKYFEFLREVMHLADAEGEGAKRLLECSSAEAGESSDGRPQGLRVSKDIVDRYLAEADSFRASLFPIVVKRACSDCPPPPSGCCPPYSQPPPLHASRAVHLSACRPQQSSSHCKQSVPSPLPVTRSDSLASRREEGI